MMMMIIIIIIIITTTINQITKTQFRIILAFDDSVDDKILEYFSSEEETISCC